MKTRLIATLTALTLTAWAGTSARAEETALAPEWQQPGYVMDVVIVKAKRPQTTFAIPAAAADTSGVELASEQDGYVMDVVIVRASRSQALAEVRAAARQAALARQELFRNGAIWQTLGAPAR